MSSMAMSSSKARVIFKAPQRLTAQSMCSENTRSIWFHGGAYDFWITKGRRVYFEMKRCIVVVGSDGTIMMERALSINSLRNKYEVEEVNKLEIKGDNVSMISNSVRGPSPSPPMCPDQRCPCYRCLQPRLLRITLAVEL